MSINNSKLNATDINIIQLLQYQINIINHLLLLIFMNIDFLNLCNPIFELFLLNYY